MDGGFGELGSARRSTEILAADVIPIPRLTCNKYRGERAIRDEVLLVAARRRFLLVSRGSCLGVVDKPQPSHTPFLFFL